MQAVLGQPSTWAAPTEATGDPAGSWNGDMDMHMGAHGCSCGCTWESMEMHRALNRHTGTDHLCSLAETQ